MLVLLCHMLLCSMYPLNSQFVDAWLPEFLFYFTTTGNDNFKSQFQENVRPLIKTSGHGDEYQEALIIDGEC